MMKFNVRSVPFQQTGKFPELFLDYVSCKKELSEFYGHIPTRDGLIAAHKENKNADVIRNEVCDVIREQYHETGIAADEQLLQQLSLSDTATICTGHQLCIFTGPLYFIYKIVSVIRIAEELTQAGRKTVPVYWMASEDHDFAEISEVHLFGKTIKWETDSGGAVGRLSTDTLQSTILQLKEITGAGDNAEKMNELIARAYRPGRTLAQATREFVHELFKGKVLILDADHPKLKKYFSELMIKDAFDHLPEEHVNASIEKLEGAGYPVQVKPRAVNLFYFEGTKRCRVEEKEGRFVLIGGEKTFSRDELMKEIASHPEHFSPNVVLRPLYQQIILPNIAYVGGPGELSYWLEYKRMFDAFGVNYPVLIPRHFALLSEQISEEKFGKLGFNFNDIFRDTEELIREYVKRNSSANASLEKEKQELALIFDGIRIKLSSIDPTLKASADAELQKQLNALIALESKALKAEKQKNETGVNQIRKIVSKYLPEGTLQERYENFIPYYLKYGDALIPALKDSFIFPCSELLLLEA